MPRRKSLNPDKNGAQLVEAPQPQRQGQTSRHIENAGGNIWKLGAGASRTAGACARRRRLKREHMASPQAYSHCSDLWDDQRVSGHIEGEQEALHNSLPATVES